ncbi:MAG: MotA/TolQ/ExbB proton channel family protein [Candidatus Omnitrophota bacterium]
MWLWFLKGGPLMWPILLCSIASAAFIIERLYYFYSNRSSAPNIDARVRNLLKQKKIDEALELCESSSGYIAHILGIAIRIRTRTREDRDRILTKYATRIIRKAEKNIDFLAIIANISPLLGLTGTVTGMINCFMKIQNLQGAANVASLAGGVWEALITTAFGLFVAIPAMAFHHYFETKVNNMLDDIKDISIEIIEDDSLLI